MKNLDTYGFTYTTNVIIITKVVGGTTLKISAELMADMTEKEALDIVRDILKDIIMSEGLELDGGGALKETLATGQKRLVRKNNICKEMSNIYTCDYSYTTNAIIVTKQLEGITIKISAEFMSDVPKEEALNTVLDIISDIYLSKGCSYDISWESASDKNLVRLKR